MWRGQTLWALNELSSRRALKPQQTNKHEVMPVKQNHRVLFLSEASLPRQVESLNNLDASRCQENVVQRFSSLTFYSSKYLHEVVGSLRSMTCGLNKNANRKKCLHRHWRSMFSADLKQPPKGQQTEGFMGSDR